MDTTIHAYADGRLQFSWEADLLHRFPRRIQINAIWGGWSGAFMGRTHVKYPHAVREAVAEMAASGWDLIKLERFWAQAVLTFSNGADQTYTLDVRAF